MRWALLAVLSTPVAAERFDCAMADGQRVTFDINPALFVNELNADEPIRRMTTTVMIDGAQTSGEPFRIGDLRGFSYEALMGGTTVFVVNADGSAVMTNRRADLRIEGTCRTE